MEARAEHQRTKHYQAFYAFTTAVGAGLLVLVLVWILHHRGGFAGQSDPGLEFNWHPFLMVLGMVFLYSQSILSYRTFRYVPKLKLKILHASLHGSAFVMVVLGLKAAFDSHNLKNPPVPNLYTMHSWIGLVTVIIFSAQYVFGFVSFLYPGISKNLRQASMPVHIAFGTSGFVMAMITVVSGFTEKTLWTLGTKYSELPGEGVLVNLMAVVTVLYGLLVLYMVNEPDYKRVSLPEDEIALSNSRD